MKISLFEEINNYTPKRDKSFSRKYDRNKSLPIFDSKTPNHLWRLLFMGVVVVIIYFVFIGRAINIQISNREKYLTLAEENRIRDFSILPGRGLIVDRNGEVIVRNKPSFSIELNTLICGSSDSKVDCATVIETVNSEVEIEEEERILQELSEKRTNIILARGVDKETVVQLESNTSELPGVSIETAPARDYLHGDSFAHLIGYVGLAETLTPEIIGKSGVEEYYNRDLSGVAGNKIVQVNSSATTYRLISSKDSLPGKDIELFADIELQNKAYELLKAKIEDPESTANAGAVVAQNPMDGSIIALVSYPSFDSNLLASGISKTELAELNNDPDFPFFNRALSAAYPPGSTFKLVTASAVLMENIANRITSIFDEGFIQIGSFIFRNWKTDGHGNVNMLRALQVSNDTYFYTMGGGFGGVGGLGIELLSKWARLFGYGSDTGIDLPGEVSGYMPDGTAREWYLGDDYISAIGQGDILATPLQVNNMMTYFANGGYLFKPRVVKNIDGKGETEVEVIAQNLVDNENYDLIRRGVNLASSPGGTAYPMFDFPARYGVQVAGKTGTSEYISREGEEKTHAWFTVFAPYYRNVEDQVRVHPEIDRPITITVFLEGGGGGSDDAAPIARELMGVWFDE